MSRFYSSKNYFSPFPTPLPKIALIDGREIYFHSGPERVCSNSDWQLRRESCVSIHVHKLVMLTTSSLSIHGRSIEVNNVDRLNQSTLMFLGGYAYEYVRGIQSGG